MSSYKKHVLKKDNWAYVKRSLVTKKLNRIIKDLDKASKLLSTSLNDLGLLYTELKPIRSPAMSPRGKPRDYFIRLQLIRLIDDHPEGIYKQTVISTLKDLASISTVNRILHDMYGKRIKPVRDKHSVILYPIIQEDVPSPVVLEDPGSIVLGDPVVLEDPGSIVLKQEAVFKPELVDELLEGL